MEKFKFPNSEIRVYKDKMRIFKLDNSEEFVIWSDNRPDRIGLRCRYKEYGLEPDYGILNFKLMNEFKTIEKAIIPIKRHYEFDLTKFEDGLFIRLSKIFD